MRHIALLVLITSLLGCKPKDERLARPLAPSRQPHYDFFNDIRLDIGALEPLYPRLEGFTDDTRKYLQSHRSQSLYRIAGMYFEKNKNRAQGAYQYEDRFLVNGCQLHCIIYPHEQYDLYQSLVGYRKGYGRELEKSLVYYQIFTANPVDTLLEEQIKHIIDRNIDKHAPYLVTPGQ